MCHNASICVGLVAAYGMGGFLPDPEDLQANKDDEMWRIIYLMPALIGLVGIILILSVFRQEPISYCIMMGYEEQGMAHMRRLYRKVDPDSPETIDEILEMQYSFMKRSTTMDASSTTFKQAVCGRKYRRASWTCFILNCFNQHSGISAIIIYANRLLVQMEEQGGGSFPLTPVQGTYFIGLSNALPAILAILTI